MQSGQRLFRDAVAATCGSPKTNPGTIAPSGSRPYAVYRFTNSLSSAACYTFTVTTTSGAVQEVAYTSYDPSNAAANYLADSGNSSALETMSLTAPAGASFDVVVVGVATAANAAYVLDVAGCTAEPSVALAIAGPNPSVSGQKAYFRAFVTGMGAPPTGTVAFMDGATNLGTSALDGSGSALWIGSSLGVGTHAITAAYTGDPRYTARTSSAVSQVVGVASTSTILQAAQVPQVEGRPSIFIATVDAMAPSRATPTGTVEFFELGKSLGAAPLAASRATLSLVLPAGSNLIYATYSGDTRFATSTSAECYQRIESFWPLTLTATPSNSTYGTPVRFDLTVLAGTGGTPTGTVIFKDDTTELAVVDVLSGTASLTIPQLAVGAHTIYAEYSGDGSHGGEWMSIAHTVDVSPTTPALTSVTNPAVSGQWVTFTATVSGSGGVPSGLLAMYDGAVMVGSATLDPTGRATFTTSLLAVGTHPLTIAYDGDVNYAPSTSSVLSQQVNKSDATVGLASSQNPQQVGAAVTFNATVSEPLPGTRAASGNVSFYDDSSVRTLLGTSALNGGKATLDVSTLALGTHVVTAEYAGDTSFNPASSPSLSQNIAAAVSVVTLAATPNPSRFGDSVHVQATVAPGTGGTATGTIAFSDGAAALATAALNGSGTAQIDVSTLSVGSHTISAAYGGDSSHSAATAAVAHSVSKAPTTTVLTSSANPSRVGQPVTLTATVTSSGGTPQGAVLFKEGTAILGTATLESSGVAHLNLPSLPAGDHVITVTYSGSAAFDVSSTAEPTQVVSKVATTISLLSSSNPVDTVSPLTLTATLQTVPPGVGVPSGRVMLMEGTTQLTDAPWEGNPLSFEMGAQLSAGMHDLTVVYEGDGGFARSASPVLKQIVTKAGGVAVTVSVIPRSYGLLTVLYTTVREPSGWSATGTVTFTEGGTTLGSLAVDESGRADLVINSIDAGTHSVTVTYGGNDKFLPASAIAAFVIPQRRTGLTLTSSTSSPFAGEPFTLRAALSRAPTVTMENEPQGPLPPVIGNVIFRDGQTVLGIVPIPNGSTTLTVSLLAIGWHDLSALYEGSNNYGPSEGNLRLGVIGGAIDGGPPEGGTPDAGQEGGYDAPSVLDGGSSMPETGPIADVGAMDAPVRDGVMGDAMQSDAADVARTDSRNADDGSPALPPALPDGVTTGPAGCGCYMAAPSSGTRDLWAVGFALGFVVIRRRNRRVGPRHSC